MADFFKNNPMALRNCIRFEILQGNSIEQAFSNFCAVLRKEVMDYKKFKIRFNHFSKKKFNDKEKPCAKYLRDDKYALLVCVLYEALKYQSSKLSGPIFEVFVNFCKVIGVEDVLKFPEFEFWFYRFLNGEFDLKYEKDEDKKIYELMDMPIDVMKNVVEYLDMFDRFKLAKTSRSLQTFVEDQKLFHHTLKLRIGDDITTISFDKSNNIEYLWKNVGRKKHLRHWRQALLDLKSILKNPKLHLDFLKIELAVNNEGVLNYLKNALKFTHHLNVKNLILEKYAIDKISIIVPMLKPGYLTTIQIVTYNWNVDSINTVFETEQWKQAKRFSMAGNCFIWPLHHLYHFKEFHVRSMELTVEDIREMKEILFKSPNFEWCVVNCYTDGAEAIEEEFGDYIQQRGIYSEYVKIYRYPIPNSSEYFEIFFEGSYFKITRMKR